MARDGQQRRPADPISLLLVEGETDKIFYDRVKCEILTDTRSTVENLQGLYNINKKIIEKIYRYYNNHPRDLIRVYCCIDRESRDKPPPEFDIEVIKQNIKEQSFTRVLSIDSIFATQQIESWFFYDIEGVYIHLSVPRARRNVRTFRPPHSYGYKDLQRLFERYNKTYTKGKRSEHFIQRLDMRRICSDCVELRNGISLIQRQSNSLQNHLFPNS